MQKFPINWFAILAAVIIKQAIDAFWYSPALFGLIVVQASRRLRSGDEGRPRQGAYPGRDRLRADGLCAGPCGALRRRAELGAGRSSRFFQFVAVATLGSVTFEKRPLQLYLINNAYLLLALLLMAAVLAVWP